MGCFIIKNSTTKNKVRLIWIVEIDWLRSIQFNPLWKKGGRKLTPFSTKGIEVVVRYVRIHYTT